MKLFLRLILIGVLTYFLSLIFPWWIIVIIGIGVGLLIPGGSLSTFISGFIGVGIVWMGHAWNLDALNGSVFTLKMLEVLGLFDDTLLLIVFTGFIGGLVGGFATMTGSMFRVPPKKVGGTGGYYS
jgi:hypothetical protein